MRTTLTSSFRHAWTGLVETVAFQRSMRLHVVAALAVSLVGSGVPLGLAEKVTLLFCVLLVFFAEILNSALEHLVDLAIQEVDEHARKAKDAGAAGVLVLALGTVAIFAALLVHNASTLSAYRSEILRQAALGTPLLACAGALLWVSKSATFDGALLVIGAALLGLLAQTSTSAVFSSLAAALLFLCWKAARSRARYENTTS